jgi:N-methylhydantoinase B
MTNVDPFTLEIIHRRLISIAKEMKITTMRTAYTQLWKEQGDLSCCIMDSSGEIIAQDPLGFPVHMTTMPDQLQGMLRSIDVDSLVEGDVLITNDPFLGGSHLPDVLIARPMFERGELYAFSCTRGHWADIGGGGPGSYSPCTSELIQEGLVIPPLKLFRGGVLCEDVVEIVMNNVRNRRNAEGDLRAQYASCLTAERRAGELISTYGLPTVQSAMKEILDRSERLARISVPRFRPGTYRATDYVDGDGVSDRTITIDLELTIDGREIVADLRGSSASSGGGMNCSRAAAVSAVQYAVKCMTDPENPPNSGSYRPVKVLTEPGTVVDAQRPSAMVGYGEIVYRVMDAVFRALSEAAPEQAIASGSGSTGTAVVSGEHDGSPGSYFTAIELSSGATGGSISGDGQNAIRYGMGNAGHIPIEADEMENPFFFLRYEIVPDTGGAGKHRGGNAFCRAFRVESNSAMLTLCADRHVTRPQGFDGGEPGSAAVYKLDPGTSRERVLTSKTNYLPLEAGTVVHLQSAGGGGFGRPGDRDPAAVYDDLRNGYITAEEASNKYGIRMIPANCRPNNGPAR